MHKTFLEEVLDELEDKRIPMETCRFVLPSKRSGTFLKQHIAKRLERNIFAPEVHSIQEFMEMLSGMKQAATLESLLLLYTAYRESDLNRQEDFSSFIKWGQTLLQDFMAIDSYLLPSGEILNYLSAIKELDHWSLNKEKTPLMENYLQLWGRLEAIYNRFDSDQRERGRGHQGLVQRLAVERLKGGLIPKDPRTTVFVGFNALSGAESEIIQHLLSQGNSFILWDIDPAYLEDPIHEAGFFIRKYLRQWPYYQKRDNLPAKGKTSTAREIHITGVPKNASQTKYAGQLLQQMGEGQAVDFRDTALVLADEGLLQPMMKAIPKAVGEVNITMGLPLDKTILYSFFNSYLELCTERSPRGWYHKQVLEFLSNPYTQIISAAANPPFAHNLAQEVKEGNYLYLDPKMLLSHDGAMELPLFPEERLRPRQWVENCLSLIGALKNIHQDQGNSLELEYLYRFYTLFNQMGQYLEGVDFITDLKSMKMLLKQLAALETLDFIGEPLSGLQIMGMLESRNLDFGTVILSSVNEGILPAGKSNNSFIPYDVKQQYGLPTHKERDAIYTYHFYRLIRRAKKVHIIYNTEADVLEGGERSRLISQLLTDPQIQPRPTHSLAAPKISIPPVLPLQLQKGEPMMQALKELALKGFSPTSLTNYLRDPIGFHQNNVLRINEVEEVEETMAANKFGNIIHHCLEQLYRPWIGSALNPRDLIDQIPLLPALVSTEFQRELPGVDITKGRFLLVHHVILRYLENFLALEAEESKTHSVKLLALEERYMIPLEVDGLEFPIHLKGALDRVDEIDGQLRIIDYKTGRVEPAQVKIKDWEDLLVDTKKDKAFQLLCYAYIHHHKFGSLPIQAGIRSFKNLDQGLLLFMDANNSLIDQSGLARFGEQLHLLIREIFDPSIPLTEKMQ